MIIYLRQNRRRPVWIGPRPYAYDVQAAVPDGWCSRCGAEVFGLSCGRCAERKETQ